MNRPRDRQRRLAQSLKPNARWLAAPRRGLTRVQRAARRWLTPLIELDIPRGLGAAATALFILGSVGYGVSAGGHVTEIAGELRRACDAAADSAGLRITSITLDGEHQIGRTGILALAGIGDDSSLLCLDAGATRAALTRNPWIADATVLKLYPGRLQISITERAPLALWQKGGRVSVIAPDGAVLEDFTGARFTTLPLVVGDGADKQGRDFLAMVGRYPLLRDTVEVSVLVAQRRWNLRLKSGLEVKLPDADVEQALQTLVALDRDKKILSRDITTIDLRLPGRVIVRLSDEAAQARDAVMKELLKKPKKKAGDA